MSVAAPKSDSQPGAEPTSQVDYSSTSDLDLANILYIQNIPIVPANKKEELDARIKSINLWLAWELTRVENLLETKVKGGELPGDDSVASKSKRTSYRSKVVTAHRGGSPWLVGFSTATSSSKATAGEDKINLVVLHALLGAAAVPNSPQVLNVVKAVGTGFNGVAQTVQPNVFYIIDYHHDDVRDVITASIKSFTFNVTVTKTAAPAPPPPKKSLLGRATEVVPPKGNFYEAAVEYVNTSVDFDFVLWDEQAPKDEAPYARGKQLLTQKQLWLLEGF